MHRVGLLAALVIAIACAGGNDSSSAGGSAGLATVFDSSGDSIVARVDGDVPTRYVRSLTDDMRIAPSADDTTLFGEIRQFAVGRDGRIWVYDGPSSSIFLFAADGSLIRRIGRAGGGPGEFQGNGGMAALPDSGIAIWDPSNARISRFDRAGDFRTSTRTTGGYFSINSVRSDRAGNIYLQWPIRLGDGPSARTRRGLLHLASTGEFTDTLLPPEVEVQSTSYTARSADGHMMSSTGASHGPRALWDWDAAGWFAAANGGTGEIILARPQGKPVVIRRTIPPVPVADEENAAEERRIVALLQHVDPGWSFPGTLPAAKAPLEQLFMPRDGRIWVRVAVPSERIPDAELPAPRENAPPAVPFREPLAYEVFDTTGRFLGRVTLPNKAVLMEADGDTVWLIERDADDLPAVVRAHVTPGFGDAP